MKDIMGRFLGSLVAGSVIGISIWRPWKDSSRTIEVSGEGKIMSVDAKFAFCIEVI